MKQRDWIFFLILRGFAMALKMAIERLPFLNYLLNLTENT